MGKKINVGKKPTSTFRSRNAIARWYIRIWKKKPSLAPRTFDEAMFYLTEKKILAPSYQHMILRSPYSQLKMLGCNKIINSSSDQSSLSNSGQESEDKSDQSMVSIVSSPRVELHNESSSIQSKDKSDQSMVSILSSPREELHNESSSIKSKYKSDDTILSSDSFTNLEEMNDIILGVKESIKSIHSYSYSADESQLHHDSSSIQSDDMSDHTVLSTQPSTNMEQPNIIMRGDDKSIRSLCYSADESEVHIESAGSIEDSIINFKVDTSGSIQDVSIPCEFPPLKYISIPSGKANLDEKKEYGATGTGSFFSLTEDNLLCRLIVKGRRVNASDLPVATNWFIENRNVRFIPSKCYGVTVAVKENDENDVFNIGWILHHISSIDGFVYLKLKANVKWNELATMKIFSWKEAFKYFTVCYYRHRSSYFKPTVFYLNQITGKRLFFQNIGNDVIAPCDGKFQYDPSGPDIMIPYKMSKIEISSVIERNCSDYFNVMQKLSTLTYRNIYRKVFKLNPSYDIHFAKKNMPFFMRPPKHIIPTLTKTLYVLDKGDNYRKHVDRSHVNQQLIAFKYLQHPNKFANIKYQDYIEKILPKSGMMTIEEHDNLLTELEVSSVHLFVVDKMNFDKGWKIRLCCQKMMNYLDENLPVKKLSVDPLIYELNELDPGSGFPHWNNIKSEDSIGTMKSLVVSSWIRSKEMNEVQVSNQDLADFRRAYGFTAFGVRDRAFSKGFNLYSGTRAANSQAAASPVESKSSLQKNQYYRRRFVVSECAPLQKIMNRLGSLVIKMPTSCESLIFKLLSPPSNKSLGQHDQIDKCTRLHLITFGNRDLISFVSSLHTDSNDATKHLNTKIGSYLNRLSVNKSKSVKEAVSYLKQWHKEQIGVCTTCVYQFVGREELEEQDEVHSYFLNEGIGIAVRLQCHVAHCFYAHSFSHRTAATAVVRIVDGEKIVFYKLPNFSVFAWGSGTLKVGDVVDVHPDLVSYSSISADDNTTSCSPSHSSDDLLNDRDWTSDETW